MINVSGSYIHALGYNSTTGVWESVSGNNYSQCISDNGGIIPLYTDICILFTTPSGFLLSTDSTKHQQRCTNMPDGLYDGTADSWENFSVYEAPGGLPRLARGFYTLSEYISRLESGEGVAFENKVHDIFNQNANFYDVDNYNKRNITTADDMISAWIVMSIKSIDSNIPKVIKYADANCGVDYKFTFVESDKNLNLEFTCNKHS